MEENQDNTDVIELLKVLFLMQFIYIQDIFLRKLSDIRRKPSDIASFQVTIYIW